MRLSGLLLKERPSASPPPENCQFSPSSASPGALPRHLPSLFLRLFSPLRPVSFDGADTPHLWQAHLEIARYLLNAQQQARVDQAGARPGRPTGGATVSGRHAVTNGNPGGKLPTGNAASRSPARHAWLPPGRPRRTAHTPPREPCEPSSAEHGRTAPATS